MSIIFSNIEYNLMFCSTNICIFGLKLCLLLILPLPVLFPIDFAANPCNCCCCCFTIAGGALPPVRGGATECVPLDLFFVGTVVGVFFFCSWGATFFGPLALIGLSSSVE